MSPDSPLGKLAQRVSALEQRVEDLVVRVTERMADIASETRRYHDEADSDVRSFAPAVREMHELKGEMKFIREQMAGLREDLQRQVDATKVDRRDTWARGAVVVAAVCFTVGTTVNLLIAVLS